MPGVRSATVCALAGAALLGLAAPGSAAGVRGLGLESVAAEPARSIGYWWECPETADDPKVDGMIAWVKQHKNIVSTLIMNCGECPLPYPRLLVPRRRRPPSPRPAPRVSGVATCDTNHSAPRGGNFSCLNNGGIGGTITGAVKASGKRALKELVPLGVKIELWLGEDDSRQSALHLFADPAKVAKDLLAVAAANEGLTGFNIDLETAHSTPADAQLSVPFLREVTATLNAHQPPLRFSTDVACSV